ncbi:hypothetical protein ZIOFF_034319 [Zingiber officinale]|uniref:AP2/ERF domain-containing protein n=1 Tax=Zingiber officinale TaxID=94328 RepID=A0A8J5GPB6_ZINOF|nr:hypothetical protein ZIOFF_034319 [Zingiber officinale]
MDTAEQAACAYDIAARAMLGLNARTNFYYPRYPPPSPPNLPPPPSSSTPPIGLGPTLRITTTILTLALIAPFLPLLSQTLILSPIPRIRSTPLLLPRYCSELDRHHFIIISCRRYRTRRRRRRLLPHGARRQNIRLQSFCS